MVLRPPSGGTGLSVQEQHMTAHLDIAVENLDEAVAWAREAGAVLADHQPWVGSGAPRPLMLAIRARPVS